MKITKDQFINNFKKSYLESIDFGSKYITNYLSDNITFDIEFNQSSDSKLDDIFDIYLEDENRVEVNLDFDEVVAELYRKNKVPAWINISILKSNKKNTRLNLVCAGRYTDDLKNIYYVGQSTYPFGIKSPVLLPWNEVDDKYYLFYKRNKFESILDKLRWKFYTSLMKNKRN